MKYSIFIIEGGLGKNIIGTAVARAIKSNHPDRELIVLASHPIVFLNLDFVYRVYNPSALQYFYDDFIKDQDTLVFGNEVYKYGPYITGGHIIQSWIEMCGLEYNGEIPEIVFNEAQRNFSNGWNRGTPLAVLHTNGGPKNDPKSYSWARDMPYELAYQCAEDLKKAGYYVIQFCNKQEQALKNVNEVSMDELDPMYYLSVMLHSHKNILIDSSLQHVARALNKESVVIWGSTKPERLGYDFHLNIDLGLPEKQSLEGVFESYDFSGPAHQCPIVEPRTIPYEEILNYIHKKS